MVATERLATEIFSVLAERGFYTERCHEVLLRVRLTGLVTFCVETAFCNDLLKER